MGGPANGLQTGIQGPISAPQEPLPATFGGRRTKIGLPRAKGHRPGAKLFFVGPRVLGGRINWPPKRPGSGAWLTACRQASRGLFLPSEEPLPATWGGLRSKIQLPRPRAPLPGAKQFFSGPRVLGGRINWPPTRPAWGGLSNGLQTGNRGLFLTTSCHMGWTAHQNSVAPAKSTPARSQRIFFGAPAPRGAN